MSSEDAVVAFRASPRGSRAGFVVLPDGAGGALTVTVLPKPWNPSARRHLLIPEHVPGTSTHAALYEGESAEMASTPRVVGTLTRALLDLGDREGRKDLLQLVSARRSSTNPPPASAESFESVVRLMLLAKRQRIALDDHPYRGAAAESLLKVVEQQLFVEEVRRVIDRARPGYQERVDRLSNPRGALSGTSLALTLLTGTPEVDCRFDEQTMDTPVLRIVLAALRAVATDDTPAAFSHLAAPVRSQAVSVARRLDSVTVLERERALLAARQLVLHNLERPWASAAEKAVQVLSRTSVLPLDGRAGSERAVAIHLSMEKWWEQCLLGALQHVADPGTTHPQAPVGSPWAPASGTPKPEGRNADFIFVLNGRCFLADAKYKVDETSLGASDGDQMFAYSHTAVLPGSDLLTEAGAVFYAQPVRGKVRSREVLIRTTAPRYELQLLDLPFPSPTDIRTDATWRVYLEGLADSIRQALAPVATTSQPVEPTVS
jgi:hypothetical protein